MKKKSELALAIDIGGTYVKAGVITSTGNILTLKRIENPANAEPEIVVHEIVDLMHNLMLETNLNLEEFMGIGISIAAFITADGLVTATAHLSKNWINYNLKTRLDAEFSLPLYFSLDTPAPTLGEAYFGAGRGSKNFIYITVSTGIGAGIMHNGAYLTGGMGWAGGVGHIIIDEKSNRVCEGCGNQGCLETFAARQGIVQSALEKIDSDPHSLLAKLFHEDPVQLNPQHVAEAALQGDTAAIEVFQQAGHALGIGLTNMIDIVSPELVVVGGGIAMAGDLLLEPARQVVRERAFPPQHRKVRIVQAELKDLSGMFGAAALVFFDLRINL